MYTVPGTAQSTLFFFLQQDYSNFGSKLKETAEMHGLYTTKTNLKKIMR
jgi:hypothetical protein